MSTRSPALDELLATHGLDAHEAPDLESWQRFLAALSGGMLPTMQARDHFLGSISHELRAPLTSILGLTELLLESPRADDRESLELILQSGSTLLQLLNELLDLSKLRAGRFALTVHEMELDRTVTDAVSALAIQAKRKQLALTVDLDPQLPPLVLGDALRLRQVLTNLVSNAVKFTPRGAVRVEVRVGAGDHVRFAVHDQGPGLDAEQRAQVFRAFERLDVAWSREQEGTGLGLAIAEGIVASMGGSIGVESTPGEGSVFWFEVPLPWVAEPMSEPEDEAVAPVPTRSLHLLVAEDDLASRRFLARALERLGHHADVVSDGEAALERVTSGVHYDALVLDVQMPRLDGMTVARAVRRLEAGGPRTPILALTANAMRGDRERCLEAGMDDHLAKPISIQVLDAALARLVGAPSRRSVSRATSARTSTMVPWDPARVAMLRETPVSADRTLFAELAALYLGGIDEAVAALRAALVAGARSEARELAHRLKGSSASVGAARIGALADAIERRLSGDETIESILGSIDMLAAAVVATRESLPR